MNNEEDNLVNVIESAIVETALDFDPSKDADAPRDSWWLRWLKFLSLIILPAIVLGLGFLFENYVEQYGADTSYDRSVATRRVERDTTDGMKFRFGIGACVGGGLGAIYVVRCLIRRIDP
jgi:hypothetical protein